MMIRIGSSFKRIKDIKELNIEPIGGGWIVKVKTYNNPECCTIHGYFKNEEEATKEVFRVCDLIDTEESKK